MALKLEQMDAVLESIVQLMDDDTLLLVSTPSLPHT
jgi:hypothetical protein